MAPEIGGERALLLDHFQGPGRIVDHSFDLAAVADDALVFEQACDVTFIEAGNAFEIEALKRCTEIFSLGKDGAPAQARLETLKTELFEQANVFLAAPSFSLFVYRNDFIQDFPAQGFLVQRIILLQPLTDLELYTELR